MDGVAALVTDFQGDVLTVIGGLTAVVLGIPLAFKGWTLGKRVIGKI